MKIIGLKILMKKKAKKNIKIKMLNINIFYLSLNIIFYFLLHLVFIFYYYLKAAHSSIFYLFNKIVINFIHWINLIIRIITYN